VKQINNNPGQPVPHSRWPAVLVIGLALAVLGGTLTWSAFDLRERVRAQIVREDGEILDAVTLMQHLNDQTSGDTLASLADPGEQFQIALKVSKLRDVLGVRLYSGGGVFANAFPAYITDAPLAVADLIQLQHLKAVSRFSAQARQQDFDLLAETNSPPAPLLSVMVPLRTDDQKQLAGAVEFLIDGSKIARQYAELDRNLALRFSGAFLAGATVLALGLGWALRRVEKANRLLAERTQTLLEANRELALSARMSAVGAVTAHLIHGLKNPLSGLASFVSSQRAGGEGDDTEWQAALSTTQRMQEMINRVVRVLQEQQSGVEYEISAGELVGILEQKAKAAATVRGVGLETHNAAKENLSNHQTDLILLVLENLVQNGIDATPTGKMVQLSVVNSRDGLVFEVLDQGYGMPAALAANLFTPCTSTKKGGGGIGLAISKQLAQHLGATLELVSNSTAGCVFRFTVPTQKANSSKTTGSNVTNASR
jgi:signal transduction histidine kinase